MYNIISDYYEDLIRSNYRRIGWSGIITDKNGRVYPFRSKNIHKDSGTITRSCSGSVDLELGSVYASELDIGIFAADIGITDRFILYNGEIKLNALIFISNGIKSWNDAAACTWEELSNSPWQTPDAYDTIPMGVYTINEATRSPGGLISIKSFDYMLKFDKEIRPNGSTKAAFKWLQEWCDRCGVVLGMTRDEVETLPNGTMELSFAITDDINTYRDALNHLAAALCSVAQINRFGELILIPFGSMTVLQTVQASQRFNSSLADYITRFTGLYATWISGGLTEYYHEEQDDGLIVNIGTNAFLQINDDTARKRACQNIIDTLSAAQYTPFEAEIPFDPCLDPMDIISLTEGAADGEVSCLTEIVVKLNGSTAIKCVGENPKLNQAKSRWTKDIEGLLDTQDGVEGTSTFWLSDAYLNDDLIVQTAAQIATALLFRISTDKGRGDINFTMTYNMISEGTVTIVVYVDNKEWFLLQEDKRAGHAISTVTTPFEVFSLNNEQHEVRVEISCLPLISPASDLLWKTAAFYTWGEMTGHTWGASA